MDQNISGVNSKEMNECEVNNIENMNASAKEWWVEYNMTPVRLFKFKPFGKSKNQFFLWTIMIFLIMLIMGYNAIVAMFFKPNDELLFLNMIGIGVGLIIESAVFDYYRNEAFPNLTRKILKELLDSDYIENFESREKRQYVFFARGTSESHRFGLFDIKKIKVTVVPEYDELKWRKQGSKLLTATKDGESVIIDVNGNVYK